MANINFYTRLNVDILVEQKMFLGLDSGWAFQPPGNSFLALLDNYQNSSFPYEATSASLAGYDRKAL